MVVCMPSVICQAYPMKSNALRPVNNNYVPKKKKNIISWLSDSLERATSSTWVPGKNESMIRLRDRYVEVGSSRNDCSSYLDAVVCIV